MKYTFCLALLLAATTSFGQTSLIDDSVCVKIYNAGKFYIKYYTITIDKKAYKFEDIAKGKYSDLKKLPYLFPKNSVEIQIVRKRLFRYDEWVTSIQYPIDHVGETKIESGDTFIEVSTRRKKRRLVTESLIKK